MGEGYENILEKALEERPLTFEELKILLSLEEREEREKLFLAAREIRNLKGGNLIYSYGFVYLSTICRNDCLFCAFRKSNQNSPRYRKTQEEVVEAALSLASQGVNLIDLTMGEDPDTDKLSYLKGAASLISAVKKASGIPVMISPGLVSKEALGLFKEAGALFYACYQETHTPELFNILRAGQSYEKRWNVKKEAKSLGLLVEDGVLCGVGESPADLARSILNMKELGAEQVRAMAFVPYDGDIGLTLGKENDKGKGKGNGKVKGEGNGKENGKKTMARGGEAEASASAGRISPDRPRSPAENNMPGELAKERELSVTAVLRLSFPRALIPASLDVEGLCGLRPRLDAGANLITSFVPSSLGLAGVAQSGLDIENECRSVPAALPILEDLGLKMATPDQYMEKVRELS
jgi:methylornithine synthase